MRDDLQRSPSTTAEPLEQLAEMIGGQRPSHKREERIWVYREALIQAVDAERPQLQAAIQIHLAKDLLEDRSGSLSESLEAAIEALEGAASIFRDHGLPLPAAEAYTLLAAALLSRIRGSRQENVENAIRCCRRALQIQNRRSRPASWAEVADCLAGALALRIRSSRPRAQYLEKSLSLYRRALEIRNRNTIGWVSTASNLAKTLAGRILGDRAADIDEGISLLRAAEQVLIQGETSPPKWATVQINLAVLYRERLRGDLTANREQAIEILTTLLTQASPVEAVDRARSMHHLAVLYAERSRGRRAENQEWAIRGYRDALAVYTREEFPQWWMETTQNLATLYAERLLGERSRNLGKAIELYRQVLDQLDRYTSPEDWATAGSNLATALSSRGEGGVQTLREATALYHQVLEIRGRDFDPRGWGLTQMSLGNSLARLDFLGEQGSFASALEAYQNALKAQPISMFPVEHRRTQGNLADLYFLRQLWQEALDAYRAALAAGESVYQSAATPEARRAALRANLDYSTRSAYCMIQLGRPEEAMVLLEQGRTRSLNEALSDVETRLQKQSEPERTAWLATRERVAVLEAQSHLLSAEEREDFLRITEELGRQRTTLKEISERFRQVDPEFLANGMGPANALSLVSELRIPVVFLFTTPQGGAGILLRPAKSESDQGEIESFLLDRFQEEHLRSLLYGIDGNPSYLSLIVQGGHPALQDNLDRIGPILQERLLFPLAEQLAQRSFSRACIVACGSLGLLPLTALAPEGLILHLSPSVQALETAQLNRQRRGGAPRLLAVANPSSGRRPLAFAALEAQEISHHFSGDRQQVLLGPLASLARVWEEIEGITHLHFSCHGEFHFDEPLDSSLELSGGERLRLRNLFEHRLDLASLRLVVLSACQTGIIDQELPDEALSFPAVFLQAGVPATVSTLWPVPDGPTALLLMRFYLYHLIDRMEPAVALGQAQRWLRSSTARDLRLVEHSERILQETKGSHPTAYQWARRYRQRPEEIPFRHPYYWAGFVVTGL
jgi:CHAT domain-containing protein